MSTEWYEADLVIGLVAGKWVTRLMKALEPGPLRYSRLLRAVPGISSGALAGTLRRMEEAGLVVRQVSVDEVPPAVSYELTGPARELLVALTPLARWGRLHMRDAPAGPSGC